MVCLICEILTVGSYKYGRVPGVFLAFSLLPGIRRARYRESQVLLAVLLWLSGVVVRSSCRSDIHLKRYGRACTLIH